MTPSWPRAHGPAVARAVVKASPDDFLVREELGFEPSGEGEHAFLYLEKRLLNTQELAQRLSSLAGVHPGDIGFSGMKDRQAVTRQWFSVRMAGKPEPDWTALASQDDLRPPAGDDGHRDPGFLKQLDTQTILDIEGL